MNYYYYAAEMQRLCTKMSDALKALDDQFLAIFYDAASDGFKYRKDEMTLEDAKREMSQEMKDNLNTMEKRVQAKEWLACQKMQKETKEAGL